MVISKFVDELVRSIFSPVLKFGLNKARFLGVQGKHHFLRLLALNGYLKCHRSDKRSKDTFLSLAAKGWEAKKNV